MKGETWSLVSRRSASKGSRAAGSARKIKGYLLKNGNVVHAHHYQEPPKNIGELTGWPKGTVCAICGGSIG